MAQVYTGKFDFRRLRVIISCTMVIQLLYSCGNQNNRNIKEGTESILQQFSIIDSKVDSVTRMVIRDVYPPSRQTTEDMVLGINRIENDTIELMYSFHDKKNNELSNEFIPINNKRVLGFTNIGGIDIILLSNINDFNELREFLSKIISPTSKKKSFCKLKYSNSLYDKSTWEYGTMYEPLCWHFKYKDGVVSNPSGYLGY